MKIKYLLEKWFHQNAAVISTPIALQEFIWLSSLGHFANFLTKSGIYGIFWSFWLIHIEFWLIVDCSSDFNAYGTSRVHLVIIVRPFCQLFDEIWYFWIFLVILATLERILAHCRLQQWFQRPWHFKSSFGHHHQAENNKTFVIFHQLPPSIHLPWNSRAVGRSENLRGQIDWWNTKICNKWSFSYKTSFICLGAVHKLCRLKRGGGGVKSCQFYFVKRRLREGRGSKISNFETT